MPRPKNAEQWKVVSQFTCYEVSSMGRLRRLYSSGNWTGGRVSRISKVNAQGYLTVRLVCDGRVRNTAMHRLVAEEFLGPPPFDGAEVCHNDGSRNNNVVENLRWGSRSDNQLDRRKHGTAPIGKRNANGRFNDVDIERMRDMRRSGVPLKKIASVFELRGNGYLSRICNGFARVCSENSAHG